MLKKLITVLMITVTLCLFSAEKYAILIAGDYNATGIPSTAQWNGGLGDNSEFWNDLYLQWEMLFQMGYKKENIKVLFSEGIDYWKDETREIANRYRPFNATGTLDETITNFAATEANVATVCAELNSKMEYGEDFVFVWVMSRSSSSSIYLMNDALTGNVAVSFSTFANYFKPLNALNKVYQLSMNSAENLEIQLQQDNAVIISSSINLYGFNKSYRADNKIFESEKGPADYIVVENESINGDIYYHGEMNFHLYSATMGMRPDYEIFYYYLTSGPVYEDFFSEADLNYDNQISIMESYTWMKGVPGENPRESTDDIPTIYPDNDLYGKSNFMSLKYPTLITNAIDGVYWGIHTLCAGNIGISNSVILLDPLNVENFSDVTIFDSGAEEPSIEGDFVFNNCDVKGETDKFPVNLDGNFILKGARLKNLQLNFTGTGAIVPNVGSISDSEINLTVPGNIAFSDNSRLTLRDCDVNGIMNLPANSTLTVSGEVRIKEGAEFYGLANSLIKIGPNGRLIIETGAKCSLTDMIVMSGPAGAISPEVGSDFTAISVDFVPDLDEPDPDKVTEAWSGITLGAYGNACIEDCEFVNAKSAISGSPSTLKITNCTFTDCENGISIVECNDFTIENNTLTGIGTGSGIALTQSEGELVRNTVSGFSHGVDVTLCSPMLSNNKINGNTNYGVCILGYNANPQLIDPTTTQNYLNNEIKDNGTAQIFMKYSASAYMTNGRNNIYSGNAGTIPSVPCIFAGSYTVEPAKVALPSRVDIDAEYNYWGYSNIEDNYDSFFAIWSTSVLNGYRLFYQPYSTVPYRTENQIPDASMSAHTPPDPGSILLNNAIKQELSGNLKASIKLYENVIDKYDSTSEALVALARLPYVYLQQQLETDPLIKLYDDALISDETMNKKFFKEMKVATFLKTKKYDEAILISEEMKAEAETDGEILLAEIDIAIANMMKNAENSGKSRSNVNSSDISALISKLTGGEDKSEPSYAVESVLPSVATLHQNYPNPFNPVTLIKFDLAKTANVKLSVYNVNGQKLADLTNGVMNAGAHSVEFDGSRFNSGVYYYTLEAEGRIFTQKMILMK